MTTFTCKAGTYWIGDPCYVFPNSGPQEHYWDDILDKADFFSIPCEVTVDEVTVLAGSTRYGDGSYMGNDGIGYGVDAGLLGIIPLSTINFLNNNHQELERLGTFYYFDDDFQVVIKDGHFNFYKVIIDTTEEYEDDYYEDDYYEDDE